MSNFDIIDAGNGRIVKAWKRGVPFDDNTIEQLKKVAQIPFVRPYVAAMADSHLGKGSTVGSVIPTEDAVIPSCVGVDIGCGMMACKINSTPLWKEALDLKKVRSEIERVVPHGRTNNGGKGDRGAWHDVPEEIAKIWGKEEFDDIPFFDQYPSAASKNSLRQLGTLGTGNHFIEVSIDENDSVWVVLHSGSRGFGNRIGSYFTQLAKERCRQWHVPLPDPELAFLPRGTEEFDGYMKGLALAQRYAWVNREIMMDRILTALNAERSETVHCHHNYMAEEKHFGKKIFLTRKGAVRARTEDAVIIPGAMGRATIIGTGLGNPDSFCSCSHGAGRVMSRTQARRDIKIEQHIAETEGLECDKTEGVIDESPSAYKRLEDVMAAQSDLVQPVHTLRALVCVKGLSDK